jgi:hypothetical protein
MRTEEPREKKTEECYEMTLSMRLENIGGR